jgi:hypothetical protein
VLPVPGDPAIGAIEHGDPPAYLDAARAAPRATGGGDDETVMRLSRLAAEPVSITLHVLADGPWTTAASRCGRSCSAAACCWPRSPCSRAPGGCSVGRVTGYGREQTRRRRPDEPEAGREDAERRAQPEPERLLELQRSAGNRAVSALVARQPEKADAKQKDTGMRVTLPKIGTIVVESVQFPPGGAHGGRGGDDKEIAGREVVITSLQGPHSTDLLKAMLDGRPLPEVVIVMPGGVRVTLRGAMISGYTVSQGGKEPLESWSLNFRAIEFGKEGDKPKEGAAGWARDREPG